MKSKYVTHRQGENFIIYDARFLKRKRRAKRIGLLCLAFSLCFSIIFLSPTLIAELKYRLNRPSSKNQLSLNGFGQLLWLDKKGVVSPSNWEFSLIIPELGINAKVKDSVSLVDSQEYESALIEGVAHAERTSFPDQPGTVYIFGHSTDYSWNVTRYNAYLYPLKYLKGGEEIIIIYKGKFFIYRVKEKKIANANDLQYLVSQSGENRLVLQTCWPPGTSWKRLIVVATPVKKT